MLNNKITIVDWYHSRETADKNSQDKINDLKSQGYSVKVIYLTQADITDPNFNYDQSLSQKELRKSWLKNTRSDCEVIYLVALYHHWKTMYKLQDWIRKFNGKDWKFFYGNIDEADKIINGDWYNAKDQTRFHIINWSTATTKQIKKTSKHTKQQNRCMSNVSEWGHKRFVQTYTEAVLKQKVKNPLFAFTKVLLSQLKTLGLIEKNEIPQIFTKINVPGVKDPVPAYTILYVLGFIDAMRKHPEFAVRLEKVGNRDKGKQLRDVARVLTRRICDPNNEIDSLILEMMENCVVLNEKPTSNKKNKKIVKKLLDNKRPCWIIQCRVLDRGYDEPQINFTGLYCTPDDQTVIWQFLFRGNRRNWNIPFEQDCQLIYIPVIVDDLSDEITYWEETTKMVMKVAQEFEPIMQYIIIALNAGTGPNPPPPPPPPQLALINFENLQDWLCAVKTSVISHSGSVAISAQKSLFMEMHDKAQNYFHNPNDKNEIAEFYKSFKNHPFIKLLSDIRRGGDKNRYPDPKNASRREVLVAQKIFNANFSTLDNDEECLDRLDQWNLWKDSFNKRRIKMHEAIARLIRKFIDNKISLKDKTLSWISCESKEYHQYLDHLSQVFGVSLRPRFHDMTAKLNHLGKLIRGEHKFLGEESKKEGQAWYVNRDISDTYDNINQEFMDCMYTLLGHYCSVDLAQKHGLAYGYLRNNIIAHPILFADYDSSKRLISDAQWNKYDAWVKNMQQKTFMIVDQMVNEYIKIHDRDENSNKEEGSSKIVWKQEMDEFNKKITKNPSQTHIINMNTITHPYMNNNTKNKLILWRKARQQRLKNTYKNIEFLFQTKKYTKTEIGKKFKIGSHLLDKLYGRKKNTLKKII